MREAEGRTAVGAGLGLGAGEDISEVNIWNVEGFEELEVEFVRWEAW